MLVGLALLAGCAQQPPDQSLVGDSPVVARPLAAAPASVLPVLSPVFPAIEQPTATTSSPTPPEPEPSEPPAAAEPEPAGRPDCSKLKCVALTMDDGPVPGTAKVLDLLKRKGVHATFFVVGELAAAHPGLVRRMAREGHVVGNHSWSHPEFFGRPAKRLQGQLSRTDKVLHLATGHDSVLMRPPFGEVTRRLKQDCRRMGEAVVLWDVDPKDWKDRKATTVVKRVLRRVKRGSIILTHDSLKTTRKAYARIIDGLRRKGFTLVTVPELFAGRMHAGKVYLRG